MLSCGHLEIWPNYIEDDSAYDSRASRCDELTDWGGLCGQERAEPGAGRDKSCFWHVGGHIGEFLTLLLSKIKSGTRCPLARSCHRVLRPHGAPFLKIDRPLVVRPLILIGCRRLGWLRCRRLGRRLRLLPLLGLLRRLKIRVGLSGALGVSGRCRVVGWLRPVCRLVPSLLRLLLTAGLAALLGCSLCAGLVDRDAVVLIHRWLITALILGLLSWHFRWPELGTSAVCHPTCRPRRAGRVGTHSRHGGETTAWRGVVAHHLHRADDHCCGSYHGQRLSKRR